VFVSQLPLDENASGLYILILTQDKQQRRLCKTCPLSWNVSVTINILQVGEAGQINRLPVDDAEEDILNAVNECSGILQFDNFEITKTDISNSFNDELELPTQAFSRQIIRIEHQIYQKDETT
jgi:hypothetical protein